MHAGQVVPRIDATCIAVVQGRYPEATTELSDIAAKDCSNIISYHVQYSILLVQGNITVIHGKAQEYSNTMLVLADLGGLALALQTSIYQ
ncbi:hypothetical protein EYR41_001123 [Orbilia oligospora]|uniref:Uncharacterized protein n=1 Tax=Orbilia oligospora TaxID=2813651 RepID=A0A8H2E7Q8_ORBOL|nr:hypothetical protein TWF132_010728 [Orbilia oligospora]TGJ74075.1 hypothetical protein EYR41_001123 [Orbilia oligospora]